MNRILTAVAVLGAAATCLAASAVASADELKSLTVCADPGNMPLSNQNGEGFENKIAEVIGKALGTGVHYYWRPSIERGLMRTTLSEGNCDLWMDMATDTEGAVVLKPLYRSTFVLAYRSDKGIHIKDLDDPALKKLRVGVFQVSAIRQALSDHGVQSNTVVHYLSHNADILVQNQPSYQVEQVVRGELDVAAVWGPMAGYYKAMRHEPLVIQPTNLMEDLVPLEFDLALAVPRGRPDIKSQIEQAIAQHASEIRRILDDYGVPLVKCDDCFISGDLPSHGPYKQPAPDTQTASRDSPETVKMRAARLADLKRTLAKGGSADDELNMAATDGDIDRVQYALNHGGHVDVRDGEYVTPLLNAARFGFNDIATYLLERKADPNLADRGGWTALMFASWGDNAPLVKILVEHGAKLTAADRDGLTAIAIASQNAKIKAAQALIEAGADINSPVGTGGYTPLMLASLSGSSDLASLLISRGAKVNATNPGGVTALMIAAANDHPRMAELLLKSGADVSARSTDGRTAIGLAKGSNNVELVKLLESAARQQADGKSG